MKNTEIVNNLRLLRAAIEAQPEKLFHLSNFKVDEPCGTLFCSVGLACTMPEFQAKGFGFVLEADWFGGKHFIAAVNGESVMDSGVTDPTFGEDAYRRLFSIDGSGVFDDELGYDWFVESEARMTHKQLALLRLDKQISLYNTGNSDAP